MIGKSITYRAWAIVLALLVLTTSMSYAVDLHYCQGTLKSFSIFGKAQKCHEQSDKRIFCPHHQKWMDMEVTDCSDEDKNCCSSRTELVEADHDLQYQKDVVEKSPDSLYFTAICTSSIWNNFDASFTKNSTKFSYKPPLIARDISVLFEVFLL